MSQRIIILTTPLKWAKPYELQDKLPFQTAAAISLFSASIPLKGSLLLLPIHMVGPL